MAKLFKHFGIGGKKVSDNPCHQDLVTSKTSGSVSELRSNSPLKNRTSAIVLSSNSWVGTSSASAASAGERPEVTVDGRRHSDASTIRNIRSKLLSHPRTDWSLRGTRTKEMHGEGANSRANSELPWQCENASLNRGKSYNINDRSSHKRSQCAAVSPTGPNRGVPPQILTEYSDPFDLKQQMNNEEEDDEERSTEVKVFHNEDDYSVPYEDQKQASKMTFKDNETDVKSSVILYKCNHPPPPTPETISVFPLVGGTSRSFDSAAAAQAIGRPLRERIPTENERPNAMGSETRPNPSVSLEPNYSATDLSQPSTPKTWLAGVTENSVLEGNPRLGEDFEKRPDASAGMYDSPWDLWATQKNIEGKLRAARDSQNSASTHRSISYDGTVLQQQQQPRQTVKPTQENSYAGDEPWHMSREEIERSLRLTNGAGGKMCERCLEGNEAAGQRFRTMSDERKSSRRTDDALACKPHGGTVWDNKTTSSIAGKSFSFRHSTSSTVQRDHSVRCQHHHHHHLQSNFSTLSLPMEDIDLTIPLEQQSWYHGSISRVDAERLLRICKEGSYLVRNSESNRQHYSLSLKSNCGFMHMKIVEENSYFILGQFSQPFESIPEMIQFYMVNKLPIRGTEHMTLAFPISSDLL